VQGLTCGKKAALCVPRKGTWRHRIHEPHMGAMVYGGASGATSQLTSILINKSKEAVMKKLTVFIIVIVFTFLFSSMSMAKRKTPPSTPAVSPIAIGDAITGCYKKVNGQLRIVSDPSKCNPSEVAISWNIVGPEGPQGPTGVVATYTLGGEAGVVSSGATDWVFAGTPANVSTVASQKITGVVQAPLGTLTAGVASFGYDLCYRSAGTSDPLTNFTGATASIGEVSDTAGRLSFTAAASATPGEGSWEVGYCIMNSGAIDLDNNDLVNGWVVVTE
jgi:hypothetical protein